MINLVMQWCLCVFSVTSLWLLGNGSKWGPWVGLVSQPIWFYYTIATHQWGLVVSTTIYTIVNIRNVLKMRHWKPQEVPAR